MKIVLSPAKKMNDVDIFFNYRQLPCYLDKTSVLKDKLCTLSIEEISRIMKCNDKISKLNYQILKSI